MTNNRSSSSVRFIPGHELESIAERVLADNGLSTDLPVDIELLCDLLEVRILIVPNLYKDFSVDAYINDTCTVIVIDEFAYFNRETRARFSIAHELSHCILHKEFLSQFSIDNIEQYLAFQDAIDNETRKNLEIQAYILAGYLLMPSSLLRPAVIEIIGDIEAASIDVNQLGQVLEALEPTFKVSSLSIAKQLARVFPEFDAVIRPLIDVQ